ncbi:hypothetical protein [Candidatus Uabimicrobium sp. HlEnr_7]|uniref:hypothetical protein n=1 Tax=Candidatus Uabimicrobium helgolandensis TaxID=3095367 RepID=UPI003557AB74
MKKNNSELIVIATFICLFLLYASIYILQTRFYAEKIHPKGGAYTVMRLLNPTKMNKIFLTIYKPVVWLEQKCTNTTVTTGAIYLNGKKE